MPQQIVLVKGWEGFADRFQVLSHLIHYCKKNNAAICVDWRDYMWGQNERDFGDYIDIVGINVVTLEDVKKRIEEGASFSPKSWTYDMIMNPPNETIHFQQYNSMINKDYDYVDSDIVLENCKGVRTWHLYNLVENFQFKPSICEIIKTRLEKLELPYSVIHLRGTDRIRDTKKEDAISLAQTAFDDLMPHSKIRTYVISDMKEMIDMWIEKNPTTKNICPDRAIYKIPTGSQGTHQLPKEALEFYDITKHDLNIDTLTDFMVIAFSNSCIGNSKESTFTKLSKFFSQSGKHGVGEWMNKWFPPEKSLKKI